MSATGMAMKFVWPESLRSSFGQNRCAAPTPYADPVPALRTVNGFVFAKFSRGHHLAPAIASGTCRRFAGPCAIGNAHAPAAEADTRSGPGGSAGRTKEWMGKPAERIMAQKLNRT